MSASDYPVTFGYGAVDNEYYGPRGSIGPYHRGDDRAMPFGTPVLVNGVQIGLSGNGNGRYGAHLHIGKFVNGSDVNPNGQGFTLSGARVISVVDNYSTDPVNAKYVRIQDSSGAAWVYLHMSQVNVSTGQVINAASPAGGNKMVDGNLINELFVGILFRLPYAEEVKRYDGKIDCWSLAHELNSSQERADLLAKLHNAGGIAQSKLDQIKDVLSK